MVRVKLLRYTENGVELIANSARVSGISDHLSGEEIVRMIVENDYSSTLGYITFTFDVFEVSVGLCPENTALPSARPCRAKIQTKEQVRQNTKKIDFCRI